VHRDPRAQEVTEAGGSADDRTVPIRPGAAHQPGRLAGWLFGAVTVMPALLAAAWLLPGLPLLLAGRLSALPLLFMSGPLALGLCYLALRQLPATWTHWPGVRAPGSSAGPAGPRPVPWWTVAATVAVAAGFAAWQVAERTQQVIYLHDPASYLQVGYWIAHHGSLPIPDSAAAFGGSHPGMSFASASYAPAGDGLSPQFMTGLPLVLAAAVWLGGVPAALVATPLIGACAVLSFGGLAGRLAGARWAPAAALVLALCLPEQFTSRGTFSEPLVQVLLFGGLCLVTDALVTGTLVTDAPVTGAKGQRAALAALGGLALGLTSLASTDALSGILPAVLFAGVLAVARRGQSIPLGLGLAVGVGYGLVGGYLLSRPYLDQQAASLLRLGLAVAVIVLLSLAGLAVTWSPGRRARLRARLGRRLTAPVVFWLPVAAAALTAGIFLGFGIRPLAQATTRYYQDGLYWVIWYIGLPAVLLGAFGLAILARRCVRALLTATDPGAEARSWALPLMTAIWAVLTVMWRLTASPQQPWSSRRLVPFVLPGLILAATWATSWLRQQAARQGRGRSTSAVVASCCTASLLIPTALTNLDLATIADNTGGGTGRHIIAQGMAFRRVGVGELAAVNGLCAAIGPEASVVILGAATADEFAQVSRGMCDTPTAVLDRPAAASLDAVVSGIERAGRRPVLLAATESELAPYGGVPKQVISLLTTQDPNDPTSAPAGPWPIRYTAWLSVPAGAPSGPA
jgi:hypothetical protein